MNDFGKAFRTIRLIKDIPAQIAASDLGIDERSLRDIEHGKTALVTERFEQLRSYYKIPAQLIFDIALEQKGLQHTVNDVKQHSTGMIFNQAQNAEKELLTQFDKRITFLEDQNKTLLEMINKLIKL
jgi:cytoskeletal protein RodZ